MNNDAAVNPINYLEMLFGRFINDSQEEDVRRLNYFVFNEVVVSFTAIGAFKDSLEYDYASSMCSRLKIILEINFD
ncbi:hypothetical protein [Acinetobacter ursingii]|uniref:hypothetical protein n=1 Tax=Acinetobacter ursingii TaxID=108980 RepID=UPI000E6AC003|nr:hypothetical protein [Acinetobacter ursingii]MEC6126256.1 hypothetical protein [Acinetobacter ursingii]